VAPVESAPVPTERVVASTVASAPPELPIPDVGDSALSHRPDPSVFATPMRPADAADRPHWGNRPRPGPALSLKIPSIALETDVVAAGVVTDEQGESEWETVPFVAAHYVDTALVGSRGNAVISGHVVTLREGNVFRNLYQMDFGQTIEVATAEGTFTYVVEDLKLVPPDAVEVMAPSPEPKLTLITCGGEFDPRTRQFSDRLVVVGKLADWSRHDTVQ
jgi:LPXTG-site transpeptidase (sortase) family protein